MTAAYLVVTDPNCFPRGMPQNGARTMRLLFVHDRFGAMAGAEVNLQLTAAELKNRGHTAGLLHGPPTGKGERAWCDLFSERFGLANGNNAAATRAALEAFQPDAIYIHKMSDGSVLKSLVESGVPVARMVHDHDLYCMRSYKYFPLTRTICTRGAGWHCIFPCGATLARNRNGGLPVKWVSYLARKREIALNRRFERMVVATDYMRQELLRNGFDPRRIEIHAPVPRAVENAVHRVVQRTQSDHLFGTGDSRQRRGCAAGIARAGSRAVRVSDFRRWQSSRVLRGTQPAAGVVGPRAISRDMFRRMSSRNFMRTRAWRW